MSIIRLRADASTLSDADLVTRVRSGDTDAYGVLWQRHSRAGATVARSYTSSFDPEDLVSESYAKILQAIRSGGGPQGAFRPYLFTTIRNTAAAWGRARRETPIDDAELIEDPAFSEENTLAALDRSLTASAFRALPTRWQEALWYSEVEGMSPQEIAPLLGMKANAVAALTYRAREGLRQAWIQAHLKSVPEGSECRWTIDRLGGYARKSLGKRDTAGLESHLHECAKCTIVAAEAKDVSSRLTLVLLPLAAGLAGATGYAAWMQTGAHTATYALGAGGIPAAAFGSHGAAVGASSAAGAAGSGGAGSGITGAAGSAVAGGGTAAATGLGGIVVGASVAGVLVIGAVVTAITLGPTLFGAAKTPSHSSAQANPAAPPPAQPPAPAASAAPSTPAPSTPAPSRPAPPAAAPSSPGAPSTPAPARTAGPAASVAPPVVVPAAPQITSAAVSADGTLTVAGTGTAGNTVSVTASATATTGTRGFARSAVLPSSVEIGTTAVRTDDTWHLNADMSALPDGGYTLSIVQTTPRGLAGPARTRSVTVRITVAPPEIASPKDGSTLDRPLTAISGTVHRADAVTVSVDGGRPQAARLVGGAWSLPVSGLGNGTHSVDVVATYKHRTSTATSRFTLAVPPSAPPAPAIDGVDVGPVDDSGSGLYYPIVSGTTAPGATVVVSNGASASVTLTADEKGHWQTSQLTGYHAGNGTVTVYRTEGSLRSKAVSRSVMISPAPRVTITPWGDWSVSEHDFTVEYTGRPGATFMPYEDDTAWTRLGMHTLDGSGTYDDGTIWYWADGSDQHSLGARYESGNRFGPTLSVPFVAPDSPSADALSRRPSAAPLPVR